MGVVIVLAGLALFSFLLLITIELASRTSRLSKATIYLLGLFVGLAGSIIYTLIVISSAELTSLLDKSTFRLHGSLVLIVLVCVFGAFGGFLGHISKPASNHVTLPFSGNQVALGSYGHICLGVGGAITVTALVLALTQIPLTSFAGEWGTSATSLTKDLVYLIAISTVGGFSGHQVMSSASDAMVKSMQKKLDEIEKNDQEQEAKISLLSAAEYIRETQYKEAIDLLEKFLGEEPEHPKANSWLGVAYKRSGNLPKALEFAIKARDVAPKNWVYEYNLACYKSLSIVDVDTETEGIVAHLAAAKRLAEEQGPAQSIRLVDSIKGRTDDYGSEVATPDCDFDKIRAHQKFREFVDNL